MSIHSIQLICPGTLYHEIDFSSLLSDPEAREHGLTLAMVWEIDHEGSERGSECHVSGEGEGEDTILGTLINEERKEEPPKKKTRKEKEGWRRMKKELKGIRKKNTDSLKKKKT